MTVPHARRSIHRIDGDDVLRYVDDVWIAFAARNGAPALTAADVLGHSLYDFIAGTETRHVYRLLLGRVRSRRLALRVPFRCDAPDTKRAMTLHIRPHSNTGVEFISELVCEESRKPVALLDASAARSNEVVRVCSWCKRILAGQRWTEIEDAIAELGLMQAKTMPQITHGMCPECLAIVQSVRS